MPIPDTRLTLESRDLATVIQSRCEELLEGVIFQLQQWGFDDVEDPVLLTGGGSRLQDVDELLRRMSGHPVESAAARRIQAPGKKCCGHLSIWWLWDCCFVPGKNRRRPLMVSEKRLSEESVRSSVFRLRNV